MALGVVRGGNQEGALRQGLADEGAAPLGAVPEANQVPLALRVRAVAKRRAAVREAVVVEVLNLPALDRELDAELRVVQNHDERSQRVLTFGVEGCTRQLRAGF